MPARGPLIGLLLCALVATLLQLPTAWVREVVQERAGRRAEARSEIAQKWGGAQRIVGPWLTAFTYGTAYFSAVLFIGFAGKVGWGFGYSAGRAGVASPR